MRNQIRDITKTAEFAEERLVASAQSLLEEVLFTKGWSKTDLATAMGVSKGRVSQIFSTNQNFTLRMLARAFHALGVTIDLDVVRPVETKSDKTSGSTLLQSFDFLDAFAWTNGESHGRSIQITDAPVLSGSVRKEIARSLRKSAPSLGEESEETRWHTQADAWGTNVIPMPRKVRAHG